MIKTVNNTSISQSDQEPDLDQQEGTFSARCFGSTYTNWNDTERISMVPVQGRHTNSLSVPFFFYGTNR